MQSSRIAAILGIRRWFVSQRATVFQVTPISSARRAWVTPKWTLASRRLSGGHCQRQCYGWTYRVSNRSSGPFMLLEPLVNPRTSQSNRPPTTDTDVSHFTEFAGSIDCVVAHTRVRGRLRDCPPETPLGPCTRKRRAPQVASVAPGAAGSSSPAFSRRPPSRITETPR